MTVSTEMFAAFGQLQDKFNEVQAQTGLVARPPEGNHDCIIVDMKVEDSTFKLDENKEVPAKRIVFRYKLVNKIPGLDVDEFPGAPFDIPIDRTGFPPNKIQQADIELGRLKGCLKTILGKDPADIRIGLAETYAKVKNPSAQVVVQLQCEYTGKKGSDKKYFKEKMPKLLS